MHPKEITKIYNDLVLKTQKKKRQCSYPGCISQAIGSHNISEAILSTFSNKGHIRMFNIHPQKGFDVSFVGIRRATRFSGLCSQHDSKLFKTIDQPDVDLLDYKNVLLFNYRATIQEELLKAHKTELYGSVVTAFSQLQYPQILYYTEIISFYEQRIKEIVFNNLVTKWYSHNLLQDYYNSTNNFVFKILKLPYFEIAASELFTFEPHTISQLKRKLFYKYGHLQNFSHLFIHIIPDPSKRFLTAVLSMYRDDLEILNWYYEYLLQQDLKKVLSNFLLLYLELWCCSDKFYHEFIKPKTGEIKKMFLETSSQNAITRETDIFLFNE